jgi:translocation and assembly module TamA
VLNHGDYDSFKSSLTRVACVKATLTASSIKASLGLARPASGLLGYRLRQRRTLPLWPVTFEGSQIRDEYLQNLVPFKEGDYYTSQDLAELNRRLAATGWFSSVVVAPNLISPQNQGAAFAGRCLAAQREHR